MRRRGRDSWLRVWLVFVDHSVAGCWPSKADALRWVTIMGSEREVYAVVGPYVLTQKGKRK